MLRVRSLCVRVFRSLSKAFDKERYAKVEVMEQFAGEQNKTNEVIVARIASSLYSSSAPVKVVRGRDGRCAPVFCVGASTVDSARRARGLAIRISRRNLWPEAEYLFCHHLHDARGLK